MENTPLKLRVAGVLLLEFVTGGTPEIRAVVGIPGTKPVSGVELAVVAVTVPALYENEPSAIEVDGWVTSMPDTIPDPPGVTYARCACGSMATCGYCPVLSETCE